MTLADDLSRQNDATAAELTVLRWLDREKAQKQKPRRRKWDARTVGSVKLRLFKKLREAGIPIPAPECLWGQQGGYRGRHWDLARWGADFTDENGKHWIVYSWSTMTECARYGVLVHDTHHRDLPGDCEVSANTPA